LFDRPQNVLLGASVGVNTGIDEGKGFSVKDYGGCFGYKADDFTAVLQA
jgi:hypothetical protein